MGDFHQPRSNPQGKQYLRCNLGSYFPGTTQLAARNSVPLGFLLKRNRLIIADDHPIFLGGLERLLSHDYEIVAQVNGGRELVDAARVHQADAIVADYQMPDLTGLEALAALRAVGIDTKVIIITMFEDVEYALDAARQGVDGFVLKRSAASELLQALQVVLEGDRWISPAIRDQFEDRELEINSARESEDTVIHSLSMRQREIIRHISKGDIAKQVASRLGISRKTVEYHKYKVMRRLGYTSSAELIRFAVRRGLDQD